MTLLCKIIRFFVFRWLRTKLISVANLLDFYFENCHELKHHNIKGLTEKHYKSSQTTIYLLTIRALFRSVKALYSPEEGSYWEPTYSHLGWFILFFCQILYIDPSVCLENVLFGWYIMQRLGSDFFLHMKSWKTQVHLINGAIDDVVC